MYNLPHNEYHYLKTWAFIFIFCELSENSSWNCLFIAATTLTSWHLLVTFCSLHLALKMRFFEHKAFEQKAVVGFGILNGISIGLLNLSLGFNSVGFYQVWFLFWFCLYNVLIQLLLTLNVFDICTQMTKLAIIPCTVLLETLFLGKKFRFYLTPCPYDDFLRLFVVIYLNILSVLSLHT